MSEAVPADLLRMCRQHTSPTGEINMHAACAHFGRATKPQALTNMKDYLLRTGQLVRHESRWYWPKEAST